MTILATVTAMRASIDLALKAIEMRDEIKLKEVKAALLDEVVSVREQALDLIQAKDQLAQAKRDLESELVRLKDHQADIQQNYERWTAMSGSTVYRSKPGVASNGGTEYLCANCAADGQKTYLQANEATRGLRCPRAHGSVTL
ncbi:hypothetical protein [Burkholderia gladioli]|uniref:hypothetical protein n=1 Tax=Burkholderia gladioli TaxID=28095 RepID=UPI000F540676|nr:hypothetical protein [Burkholderia gladioli]